jgi:hypothetical protein
LGVAQLGDGVSALPADARTREQLEWVADQVEEAGGTALLLHAETLSGRDERRLMTVLAAARAHEYDALTEKTQRALRNQSAGESERRRLLKRLRRELRMIQRRDYFPPPEREVAAALVGELAMEWAGTDAGKVLTR